MKSKSIIQLLVLAEGYAAHTGLSLARIATLVFNDGKIFTRLKAGGDLTTARLADAMQWFSDNWPEKRRWPRTRP